MSGHRDGSRLRAIWGDEAGGTLVEFGMVAALFFFLFFSIIDFGRLAFTYVFAEKAAQIAARIAVVRPPACAGVPERHLRGDTPDGEIPPRFGTSCRADATVCAAVAEVSCAGSATSATATEIWDRIEALMPAGTDVADLTFRYTFDPNLGFLGGPYTPMVTVEVNLPDFEFVSPLAGLATAAGATDSRLGADVIYPDFSVSLPAEDLAQGTDG